jgi:hypothetical protein
LRDGSPNPWQRRFAQARAVYDEALGVVRGLGNSSRISMVLTELGALLGGHFDVPPTPAPTRWSRGA